MEIKRNDSESENEKGKEIMDYIKEQMGPLLVKDCNLGWIVFSRPLFMDGKLYIDRIFELFSCSYARYFKDILSTISMKFIRDEKISLRAEIYSSAGEELKEKIIKRVREIIADLCERPCFFEEDVSMSIWVPIEEPVEKVSFLSRLKKKFFKKTKKDLKKVYAWGEHGFIEFVKDNQCSSVSIESKYKSLRGYSFHGDLVMNKDEYFIVYEARTDKTFCKVESPILFADHPTEELKDKAANDLKSRAKKLSLALPDVRVYFKEAL